MLCTLKLLSSRSHFLRYLYHRNLPRDQVYLTIPARDVALDFGARREAFAARSKDLLAKTLRELIVSLNPIRVAVVEHI